MELEWQPGGNHAPTFYHRILDRKSCSRSAPAGVATRCKRNTREKILETLELRLQPDAVQVFKPILDQIDDLSRLNELFRAAIQADSPDAFRQVLEANGN